MRRTGRGAILLAALGCAALAERLPVRSYSTADGLPRNNILCIQQDSRGFLWLGTPEGLARFDGYKLLVFDTAHGLAQPVVHDILETRQGALWIATDNGLSRFEPDAPGGAVRLTSIDLGMPTGFQGKPVTGLAEAPGWQPVDRLDQRPIPQTPGWICRPLLHARRRFLLRARPPPGESNPPRVFIIGVLAGGVPRPVPAAGAESVKGLRVNSGGGPIEIQFAAPGFAAHARHYRHKLEGGDGDWSPITSERSVVLAGLRPAGYRFLVRAVAEPAGEGPIASLEFTVVPPVYARWWFRLLIALGVAASLYALHRYKVRRVLELEQVRMRIATDLHDDLGAALSEVAVLSEVALHDGHFGKREEVLERIARRAREMLDSTGDIVWMIRPGRDRLLDLAARMRQFAGDAVDPYGIDFRFAAPDPAQDIALEPDLRRQVFYIFKEAVTNAVRHSHCTNITARLEVRGDSLRLSVADDGTGFNVSPAGGASRARHGIAGMRWRAESIGGTLSVDSSPGLGTSLQLETPLKTSTLHKLVGSHPARLS